MNNIQAIKILYQNYKKSPNMEEFDDLLTEVLIKQNNPNYNVDVEKEFTKFMDNIAFDNFYIGFKLALDIIKS